MHTGFLLQWLLDRTSVCAFTSPLEAMSPLFVLCLHLQLLAHIRSASTLQIAAAASGHCCVSGLWLWVPVLSALLRVTANVASLPPGSTNGAVRRAEGTDVEQPQHRGSCRWHPEPGPCWEVHSRLTLLAVCINVQLISTQFRSDTYICYLQCFSSGCDMLL